MKRYSQAAFTLIELLVVIGIISLLVSILLPALGRARQQANLLVCQANLRSIGQLVQIYASSNDGFAPPTWDDTNFTTLADVLTLMNGAPRAAFPFPGQPAGAEQYTPARTAGIFRDTDTPSETWYDHSMAYMTHIRAFGAVNIQSGGFLWDPITADFNGYRQRQFGTIKRSAEVMIVWDGACNLSGGDSVNYGVFRTFPNALDNYQMYNGHGFRYPEPVSASFQTEWYNNPIAIGAPIGVGGNPSSQIAGSVTQSYLKAANTDYLSGTSGGALGSDANNMRFRHMGNSTANFLFADGHVESRKLGAVYAKDICLNFK